MKNTLIIFVSLFYTITLFAQSTPNSKVSFGNQERHINFVPNSTINNTYLIQPVGRNDSTGVSTSFYLKDTSSWNFYTNDSLRFKIAGNGNIQFRKGLVLNDSALDTKNILRVNGTGRFDSSFLVQSRSDTSTFVSIENRVKHKSSSPPNSYAAFTTTPINWANGKPIPAFRVRHPKSVTGIETSYTSLYRDFLIVPYEFGMSIEYNGVVECWVGEWSIHRGGNYIDVEGNGNGWGGVLWVGDDLDVGGIRATARDNRFRGGNLHYGELSVERFTGGSQGDFRFRLPSKTDAFRFVYGKRGSDTLATKITRYGLFPPLVKSNDSIGTPEIGQMLFNLPDSNMQYFNGNKWIKLSDKRKGSYTVSSNGTNASYKILHTLGVTPAYFQVQATSADASKISYVTADAEYLYVYYVSPPPAGTNNLSWVWTAER